MAREELFDVRISVSKELSEHYNKVIEMRDKLLEDENTEDKTIVSILGATTTLIKELVKLQHDLYNSERIAVFLQILVNTLKSVDKELAASVIKAFEERYEEIV